MQGEGPGLWHQLGWGWAPGARDAASGAGVPALGSHPEREGSREGQRVLFVGAMALLFQVVSN